MIQKQSGLKDKINPQSKIKVNRIIPKAYAKQLQLVSYVVIVTQAKNASKVVQTLKKYENELEKQKERQKFENPYQIQKEKPFLKRVKKGETNIIEVLVCQVNDPNRDKLIEQIDKLGIIEKVNELKLPKTAPVTKAQFQEWSKLWPINFIQHQISKQIYHSQLEMQKLANCKYCTDQTDDFLLLDGTTLDILISTAGFCKQGTIDHPIMRLLKEWPLSSSFTADPDKYYYLTKLKMFAKRQMCGMCSMALVHSRLFSIYLDLQPTETMDSIFGCPKLNHQIIMFKLT